MNTVWRTRMPELCAERREPPTARMCQPGRERVSAMWKMTASTAAAAIGTEMPRMSPSPMKSQTSEEAVEVWMIEP